MRAVVQRAAWGRVVVDGEVVGEIGEGLVVLVAAGHDSKEEDARRLADRVVGLRIFNDDAGKMNLSLADIRTSDKPQVLVVSNFTLYGDAWSSRRPSFVRAAPYEVGERLYHAFLAELERLLGNVASGVFGSDMKLEILNDGPVTLVIDSRRATD